MTEENDPDWASSRKSFILIFNVGRGLAIFIRTSINQGFIYDLGSSEGFSPLEFLEENIIPYLDKYIAADGKESNIAQRIISHPHADHFTDIGNLFDDDDDEKDIFYAGLHTCPHDKAGSDEMLDWNRMTNSGKSDALIEKYKLLYFGRNLPLQAIMYKGKWFEQTEYGIYYVKPPIVDEICPDNDQDYSNGLSIVLYYKHGNHSILIPGDITPDVFNYLLDEEEGVEKRYTKFSKSFHVNHPDWHLKNSDQPSLKQLLQDHGLSILLAPHHGLESGFLDYLYEQLGERKPGLVVVSEKRHTDEGDGEVDPIYSSEEGSIGQNVYIDGEKSDSYSISTRNGHHILIIFDGSAKKPLVYLEKEAEDLIKRMDENA